MSKWIDTRRCILCRIRGTETTLFRFPPRPEIKKQWASFCNMDPDLLTIKDCLCINHFAPHHMIPRSPTAKKTKLRLSAVPCFKNYISEQRRSESIVNRETVKSVSSSHSIQSENSNYSVQCENSTHPIQSENSNCSVRSENSTHPIQSENSNCSVQSENSTHPIQFENSNHSVQSENSTHWVQSESSSHPIRSPAFIDVASCNDFVQETKKRTIKAPTELLYDSESTVSVDSGNEELSSLVEYEKITVINLTSPKKSTARRTVRFIGDVTAEHLKSHKDAIKYFYMAKKIAEDRNKKIHALNKQLYRLKKRLKKYEDIVKLRSARKEDPISDDDFSWPLEEEN